MAKYGNYGMRYSAGSGHIRNEEFQQLLNAPKKHPIWDDGEYIQKCYLQIMRMFEQFGDFMQSSIRRLYTRTLTKILRYHKTPLIPKPETYGAIFKRYAIKTPHNIHRAPCISIK